MNQGGAALNVSEYAITWTYGNQVLAPRTFTFPTLAGAAQVPAKGFVPPFTVPVRCSTPTCDPAVLAASPGQMFITVKGTDSSGHAIDFKSQNFTLAAAR